MATLLDVSPDVLAQIPGMIDPNLTALTGRVLSWLLYPERKTLPASCTVKVLNSDDPIETLIYNSKALRAAAGINNILDDFKPGAPLHVNRWGFFLRGDHPDFPSIGEGQLTNWRKVEGAIRVADSMDEPGQDGEVPIEDSWLQFYTQLRAKHYAYIDLNNLRPSGTQNEVGLVASGPLSFLKIYQAIAAYAGQPTLTNYLKVLSSCNEVIRKGGTYKNGAITTSLMYNHPQIEEYLKLPLTETPWLKKAVTVDDNLLESPHLDLIIQKVNEGSIWLEKVRHDKNGNRIYSNVCREIYIPNMGTCLIAHVNGGQCRTPADLRAAIVQTMQILCWVWAKSPMAGSIYLPPELDRQVGMGFLGWANFLAIQGVTYRQFVECLNLYMQGGRIADHPAGEIVWNLSKGIAEAAEVARAYGLERAFTIAPTASVSFAHRDIYGNHCTPEISPPILARGVRNSEAVNPEPFEYGEVEIASQVGPDWHYRLFELWQQLYNTTELSHSLSFELWEVVDRDWVARWLKSVLWTTYYRRPIAVQHLNKGKIRTKRQAESESLCSLDRGECSSCGDG